MIIKNAEVFTENNVFEKKDIYIDGELFCENKNNCSTVIDGTDCYLIPGLIDIHFHGCAGFDFCDGTEESIQAIADYEASIGVTTIVPATMTFNENKLLQIAGVAKNHKNESGAILCGINMEGPFISKIKKGAQNETDIHKPDIEMFDRIQKESGNLFKIVDIAPEEDENFNFIKTKKDEIIVSMAHTNADYDVAKQAIDAGISHVTHLYNAMNSPTHRNPGPVIAASDSDKYMAEIICDNIHIHPAIVRITLKMFGDDRIIFISDSMKATELDDGIYELGGQKVIVQGNCATLEDGTLAGSNTNLMKCMITAVKEMNIPLEIAVKCAAVNPAKAVGIFDKFGSIKSGKIANAVLLNKKDLSIKNVILKGKIL